MLSRLRMGVKARNSRLGHGAESSPNERRGVGGATGPHASPHRPAARGGALCAALPMRAVARGAVAGHCGDPRGSRRWVATAMPRALADAGPRGPCAPRRRERWRRVGSGGGHEGIKAFRGGRRQRAMVRRSSPAASGGSMPVGRLRRREAHWRGMGARQTCRQIQSRGVSSRIRSAKSPKNERLVVKYFSSRPSRGKRYSRAHSSIMAGS